MSDAVVLPVYNEELTVDSVLDAVACHFDGDILVIDDGSTDATVEVLGRRKDISVITHPENLGYGRALAEGISVARARGVSRVVTMDCDGQHEPGHIREFLSVLDEGYDVVSGSRYLPGSEAFGHAPAERRAVNEKVTEVINRVTGWGLTDAFCGFKAYRLSALASISLKEPGYAMPIELWAKAYREGLRVTERPIARIYRDHSRSFGGALDDPRTRMEYYMRVWNTALLGDDGEGG
ncbi:MAG: glycosyltransferase family 2 protein [Clostridiales bacterium]|nr:glycosyltransferase family 2 protein [Clostridiales bacterium]